MWRTASEAEILVVDRVELVGSDGTGGDAIVVDNVDGIGERVDS